MDNTSLKQFLKDNKDLLSDEILLNNRHVIVHLEHAVHYVYKSMQEQPSSSKLFGHRLSNYKSAVEDFIYTLRECNLDPVVIDDGRVSRTEQQRGGDPQMKYFMSTHTELSMEAMKDLEDVMQSGLRREIRPSALMRQAFREQSQHWPLEGKLVCHPFVQGTLKLAHERDCPVLSSSADYFMYPMSKGLVLLDADLFDHKHSVMDEKTGNKSIKCRLFNRRKLLDAMPALRPDCLPFLGTLLKIQGLDASGPIQGAAGALSKCFGDENPFKHGNHAANNNRLSGYLHWMQNKSSVDEMIAEFCHLASGNGASLGECQQLGAEMRLVTRDLVTLEAPNHLPTMLTAHYSPTTSEYQERVRTLYLLKSSELLEMDQFVLHCLVFKRTYYDRVQLDDLSQPSTNCLKIRPYSAALAFLRRDTYECEPTDEQLDKDSFTFFDRLHDKHYGPRKVRPARHLEGFGSLDRINIDSMASLVGADRESFLLACFRVQRHRFERMSKNLFRILSGSCYICDQLRICLVLLKFIREEKEPGSGQPVVKWDEHFAYALILSVLYKMSSPDEHDEEEPDLVSVRNGIAPILSSAATFDQSKKKERKHKSREIVHQISAFQCALEVFDMMHSTMDEIYEKLSIASWFDPSIIYKLMTSEHEPPISQLSPLVSEIVDELNNLAK